MKVKLSAVWDLEEEMDRWIDWGITFSWEEWAAWTPYAEQKENKLVKKTEKKCLEKDMEELENAADDVMQTTKKRGFRKKGIEIWIKFWKETRDVIAQKNIIR